MLDFTGVGLLSDPCKFGTDALVRFEELREDAVRFVLAAVERSEPDAYACFGEHGRSACGKDIDFHLDFLRSALETNDFSLFTGYLAWLVQVLDSRGVPHRLLIRCLDDLAEFFELRLGAGSMPIVAALLAGKDAILNGLATPGFDRPCPERWEEADAYAAAALQGKSGQAIALLERAFARGNSLPLVAVHVIQPAMYEVGKFWRQNAVSVVQEHFVTALSQSWMARGMARAKAAPGNGRRVLLGCIAGNNHVMGVRMVADAFELDGWTTYNTDATARPAEVAQQIHELRPHLVGFSAALPRHLSALREMIGGLRRELGEACPKLVVGGLVINQFPRLAEWAGAEALGADAVSAAAAGMRWKP